MTLARALASDTDPTTIATAMDAHWRTHEITVESDALAMLDREWLLTNGAGSFSMGTLPGVNARRYHGLLVAATHPPVGRVVALSQIIDELVLQWPDGEHIVGFTTCLFRKNGGRVEEPKGHALLRRFERGLTVRWTYHWRMIELSREVLLHWKQPAVTVRYDVRWKRDEAKRDRRTPQGALSGALPKAAALRLHPMVALRDFHSLLSRDPASSFDQREKNGTVTLRHQGTSATMHLEALDGGEPSSYTKTDHWWFNLFYPADAERGQGDREDVYVPGHFDLPLVPGEAMSAALTFTLGEEAAAPVVDMAPRAEHLEPIIARLSSYSDESTSLPVERRTAARAIAIAADDFVVDRTIGGRAQSTIIAGYPWFADWGRDTFIALPGLLLETRRFDEALATLRTFAGSIKGGLVPNRFDDYDESAAHYNTVDASLWFVQAALRYVEATGDDATWNDWLADACASIIEAYIAGTDNDIRMAGDGLITAGSRDTQLTWMDAACSDSSGRRVVYTPRQGKAVEINALWYACLVGLAERFEKSRADTARHYLKLAARMKRSFPKVFWNEELGACFDHVWTDAAGEDHIDRSIRPNQVFVASLPHSPLPRTRQMQIVALVRDRLLTPMGLRTLPPDDPHYHGRYAGDQFHRDEAYHQGTVWGWLIGPYAEAVLRVGRFSQAAREEARQAITPLLDRVTGDGLGQLHEIFEADAPHRPVGCIAQAWSIAEVLRVWRMLG